MNTGLHPQHMRVIITGNVIDGITIWGPFDDGSEATDWADANLRYDEEWTQAVLNDPNSYNQ